MKKLFYSIALSIASISLSSFAAEKAPLSKQQLEADLTRTIAILGNLKAQFAVCLTLRNVQCALQTSEHIKEMQELLLSQYQAVVYFKEAQPAPVRSLTNSERLKVVKSR